MRPPRDDDAQRVAELLSQHAPEPHAVEFVLREWESPAVDRERDARVTGTAYAALEHDGERAWLTLAGVPSPEVLAWAEQRARAAGLRRILSGAWQGNDAIVRELEAAGFQPKGESIRMRIEVAGRELAPSWPDGITVRTFRDGDERVVFETNRETFQDLSEAWSGTYEEWAHWVLAPPLFQPDLWFLAEDDGDVAGIALCYPHPTAAAGCVGILGVRRPWRGRGLGRALLEHSFAEFARRGFDAVILGAEAESPTGADRLYERAGMRVTHRRARYEKLLR